MKINRLKVEFVKNFVVFFFPKEKKNPRKGGIPARCVRIGPEQSFGNVFGAYWSIVIPKVTLHSS
jgi:hypothetical protein